MPAEKNADKKRLWAQGHWTQETARVVMGLKTTVQGLWKQLNHETSCTLMSEHECPEEDLEN